MGFCACVVYKVCHFSICNLFVLTHNNSRSIHEKKNNNSFLNLQFSKIFLFNFSHFASYSKSKGHVDTKHLKFFVTCTTGEQ